jgi:methyl-accepting chemotaxis protein
VGLPYAIVEAVAHHHHPRRVPIKGIDMVLAIYVSKRYNDAVPLQDKKALAAADEDAASVSSSLRLVQEKTAVNPARQKQATSLNERFQEIHDRSKSLYSAMIEHPENMTPQTQQGIAALTQDNKQMDASLGELRGAIAKDFQAELDVVTSLSRRQQTLGFIVLLLVAGGGATVSSLVTNRQIAAPVPMLADRWKDIAQGEGDLTKRLDILSQDEIGEAAKWFNIFMEKLQAVISKLAQNSNGVATSSEHMSEVGESLIANAQGTSTQAGQVTNAAQQVNRNLQTVSVATGEMTSSIQNIARNATEASRVASEAMQNARDANTGVLKLGNSSTEIGQVIKVITSIAQKTDLLALTLPWKLRAPEKLARALPSSPTR